MATGLKTYEKMPKGWKVDKRARMAPLGAVIITNGGSRFPKKGQKCRESAILITDKQLYDENQKRKVAKKNATTNPMSARCATPRANNYNAKSAQTSPKTTSKPADATSYTVKQGRTSKTFKTKTEAQTCATQSKHKATITKTNKKPTHKIVRFTARV